MQICYIANQILTKHINPIDGGACLVQKKLHTINPTNVKKVNKDVTNNDRMERMETREPQDLDTRRFLITEDNYPTESKLCFQK